MLRRAALRRRTLFGPKANRTLRCQSAILGALRSSRECSDRKGSRKEPRDDLNKTRTGIVVVVVDAAGLYLNTDRVLPGPYQDGGSDSRERVSAIVWESLLRVGTGCHEVWLQYRVAARHPVPVRSWVPPPGQLVKPGWPGPLGYQRCQARP
jgi:hypothetical protein